MTAGAPSATIIDMAVSNVGSLANMCAKLGHPAEITRDPQRIVEAARVLLPGVGSFDRGMELLQTTDGLAEAIRARVELDRPLLGICLGMQLLFDGSDEGREPGLGVVPGRVRRLPAATGDGPVKIPHMGWNTVELARPGAFDAQLNGGSRFYFVHSYAAVPADTADVVGRTTHGAPFVSVVERGSVRGVQFHPEKSHRYGAALLRAFLEQ